MARLSVRLTPRANRDAIEGWRGNALVVRVTAAPMDGRANAALIRLLAEALGLPTRDVELVSGATSRDKVVEVHGLDRDEIGLRLPGGRIR